MQPSELEFFLTSLAFNCLPAFEEEEFLAFTEDGFSDPQQRDHTCSAKKTVPPPIAVKTDPIAATPGAESSPSCV
jgi:hypothetical protein